MPSHAEPFAMTLLAFAAYFMHESPGQTRTALNMGAVSRLPLYMGANHVHHHQLATSVSNMSGSEKCREHI